ncbi:Oidioi.mRNA.OKI2018_I69.chr1.g200.t1.cds [Oikopleura dioica]|uniref:Oidioi.mRNA.OKI2018_I69.chr1.g200.t1.cds n=1 Tax=Oikopleura dioica TaxID=34765 RepID=A0ABN7SJ43_OIKDI|nr:Oidioi.mRNA.OKI2018_I69.chr1.g200.t1.cds [Oikopleura dioica]
MFGIKRGVWLSQNDPEKSDDSEDSDFEPTTKELDEVNLRKECSKSKTPKRPRKRARQEDTSNSNSAPGEAKDWGALPITVLDKIFEHLVQKEEDYRVVVKNATVNYHWWSAASRPSLRKKLKLFMYTKGKTRNHFQNFRERIIKLPEDEFQHLEQLQFANFQNHLTKTLALLNEYEFEKIETLVLLTSQLGNMQTWGEFIEKHCRNLVELRTNALVTSYKALVPVLKLQSIRKIVIHDSGPIKHGLDWGSMCPQLEHLDIYYSAMQSTMAGAEVLVTSLKLQKLRFLQLANVLLSERDLFNFLQNSKSFDGFPELEFFSLRRSFVPQRTSADVLCFFLKNAAKIQTIDLQGCSCFTFGGLSAGIGSFANRPMLKTLDLSGADARNEDDFYSFFVAQLGGAIEDLNLSGLKTRANAEEFFLNFIQNYALHARNLKNLDVSRTNIEKEEARLLLERKPLLNSLTLSGCYGIPRSWRKTIKTDEFSTAIRAFYE